MKSNEQPASPSSSRPSRRRFKDEGDRGPQPQPKGSKRDHLFSSTNNRAHHQQQGNLGYIPDERTAVSRKGDQRSVPKESSWMSPDEHRATETTQQVTDERKVVGKESSPAHRQVYRTSEWKKHTSQEQQDLDRKVAPRRPREMPWIMRQGAADSKVPAAKSGTFARETSMDRLPHQHAASRWHGSRRTDEQKKKKPGAISPQQRNWRTMNDAAVEDTEQDRLDFDTDERARSPIQACTPGAVAVSGTEGYHQSYDSVAPATVQPQDTRSEEILLNAVLVQDEIHAPTAPSVQTPASEMPYAEATVVRKKKWRRIVIALLLLAIGAGVAVALALFVFGSSSQDSPYRVLLTVVYRLDSNPHETGWILECESHTVENVPPGFYQQPNVEGKTVLQVVSEDGCTLTVIDTGGDGIEGGYFKVYYGDATQGNPDPALLLLFLSGDFENESSGEFTAAKPSEIAPTTCPSASPSQFLPSSMPTADPMQAPSQEPTADLTSDVPSTYPTATQQPSADLTSDVPSMSPTVTQQPSAADVTSDLPSTYPTVTLQPTGDVSSDPTTPLVTSPPTLQQTPPSTTLISPPPSPQKTPPPTATPPTPPPSLPPTRPPTAPPTPQPNPPPMPPPTRRPTPDPTRQPTPDPTRRPTREPTQRPTPEPTLDLETVIVNFLSLSSTINVRQSQYADETWNVRFTLSLQDVIAEQRSESITVAVPDDVNELYYEYNILDLEGDFPANAPTLKFYEITVTGVVENPIPGLGTTLPTCNQRHEQGTARGPRTMSCSYGGRSFTVEYAIKELPMTG